MARKRKSHSATLKAQVTLAAVKGEKTISEQASLHGVHPTLIHAWEKQLLDGAERLFQNGVQTSSAEHEALQAQLYEQIGRLKTELDWLKKKLPASVEHKRAWVDGSDKSCEYPHFIRLLHMLLKIIPLCKVRPYSTMQIRQTHQLFDRFKTRPAFLFFPVASSRRLRLPGKRRDLDC
jgi:putative transposase